MNVRWSGRLPAAAVRAAVAFGLAAALAACAPQATFPLRPSPAVLPPGSPLASRSLEEGDAWLRHYLMTEDYEDALGLLDRSSKLYPTDRLLRELQSAVLLHHAGRYAESNRAFEWAEREADLRYTKSLSRAAGSLLLNDRVLAYLPSPAELALIPYYRMLNYLALDRPEGALVEARKVSAYLTRMERELGRQCSGNPFLHYLAGLMYDAAGERNDALVALRQAERSFQNCGSTRLPAGFGHDLVRVAEAAGVEEVVEAARERYTLDADFERSGEEGEVVVFIEHGFVAHRARRDLYVPILAEEIVGLNSGNAEELATAATRISGRLIQNLTEQAVWRSSLDSSPFVQWNHAAEGAYVLKLAWPVSRLEASRAPAVRLLVDDHVVEAPLIEDLSSLVVQELEAQRPHIVARMVARGLVRYLVAQEAEKRAEKKGGELLGFVTGLFTNVAANVLEQADTRSWTLLPDQISMARVRLPAGEHPVRIEVFTPQGAVLDTLDLGMVTVRAGERVFLSRRVWGPDGGDPGRLVRLGVQPEAAAPSRCPSTFRCGE